MNEPLLSVSHLSMQFGGVKAVNDVSFDVRRGEVFTLIGPYALSTLVSDSNALDAAFMAAPGASC